MTENVSERIDRAIKDNEILQTLFVQKYGEECLADKEIGDVLKNSKVEHEELEQYRAIGTVEECREAREKQKPKSPDVWGDGYSDGEMVYDMYDCPGCGESYEIDGGKYDFCPNCGQALNWRT